MTSMAQLVHREKNPPKDNLICLGWQGDFGKLYSAVAHTEAGDIPGKAKYPDLCWYSCFGNERKTKDFSFVTVGKGCVSLVWSKYRPSHALNLAKEGGHFEQSLAIADTQWGKIPGKAAESLETNEGLCWYPYGGKEYSATSFAWVCKGKGEARMISTVQLVHREKNPPKDSLICLGWQADFGKLYSAIAHTEAGDVPGKAKYPDLCWYSCVGDERKTKDFSFVTVGEGCVSLVWSKTRPSHALNLGKEGGHFERSLAIADTKWGKIPGKAAESRETNQSLCWYPYGGKEYSTTSFAWVCEGTGKDTVNMTSTVKLVHKEQNPPEDSLICLGWQGDFGKLYSAVAHTEAGDVPGKARYPDLCWYSYSGNERKTTDFSFVTVGKGCVSLVWSKTRPSRALNLGKEDSHLERSLAIADTEWGKVPGKAAFSLETNQSLCWYPYGGNEHSTNSFAWVCEGTAEDTVDMTSMAQLVHREKNPPKDSLICLGWQGDFGKLYSAVAHTEAGDIPGKAKYPDLCWYSCFGEERKTKDFSFVTVGKGCVSLVWSKTRPSGALNLGKEGGHFEQSLAIADTEWGKVPGKAAESRKTNEGLCWYPYGGKEYSTTSFAWVCEGTDGAYRNNQR